MKQAIILLTIISISFFSCKEYPCSKAIGNISITGFSINETDTVIVRIYSKATNFTTPLATFILDSLNGSFYRRGDVLEIYGSISYGSDYGIISKYDYEIYLPKPNRLFQISELTEKQESRKVGFISMDKRGCINPFSSYKVNGIINGYTYSLINVSK
jgi:hypothetical protein